MVSARPLDFRPPRYHWYRGRRPSSHTAGAARSVLGLIDLLLLVDAELAGSAVDEQQEAADNGQDLEKVVLGKVLVGVVLVQLRVGLVSLLLLCMWRPGSTYRPEIVDKQVKDAQNDNEKSSAELGFEAYSNHNRCASAENGDNNTPNGPLAARHEADKQEDEKDTPGELEVHLAILLVDLGETGKRLGLAHPGIGQNHEQSANNGQIAQEKVQVEDEAVADALGNDDAHEPARGVVRVLSDDHHGRARGHYNHVGDEKEVGYTVGDYGTRRLALWEERHGPSKLGPGEGVRLLLFL